MSSSSRFRPSPTLAINESSAQLAAQGRRIHRMGFGQSPFPPPPHVVEALRENAWRRDYPPVQGVGELRERVAAFHHDRYGLDVGADDVIVGPGSKELIFIVQLIEERELLLPSPSWVSYEPQAHLLGLPVVWLPTTASDGWRLDPDVLDAYCATRSDRKRLLILNYPNNPAGTSLDTLRLERLASVARKHGLLIVADEIYGELHHEGRHVSIARFYPEGTIVTGGLSKWCGAGGWRLGTMCVPHPMHHLVKAACSVASETYSGVSTPVQHAAITAYSAGPEVDAYLTQARRVLRAIGRWVWVALHEAGLETAQPDGAFYLFPDFESVVNHDMTTSSELCHKLLADAGVALLPGEHFGRPPSERTCRLCYVSFDGERALETAARTPELDEAYIRAECPDVVAGVEAIIGWVHTLVRDGVSSYPQITGKNNPT